MTRTRSSDPWTIHGEVLAGQLQADLEAYWAECKSLPMLYSYCWGVLRSASRASDTGAAQAFAVCDAFLEEASRQLLREQHDRGLFG